MRFHNELSRISEWIRTRTDIAPSDSVHVIIWGGTKRHLLIHTRYTLHRRDSDRMRRSAGLQFRYSIGPPITTRRYILATMLLNSIAFSCLRLWIMLPNERIRLPLNDRANISVFIFYDCLIWFREILRTQERDSLKSEYSHFTSTMVITAWHWTTERVIFFDW